MKATLLLASLALVLGSCSKSKTDDPPPKAVSHHIEARVTGTDLAGMSASLLVTERLDFINGGKPKVVFAESYGSNVSKTVDVGMYGAADLISAEVSFQAVTATGPTQPRSTTRLKLEIIADGVVKETTELNQSKTGWKVRYAPHLLGAAEVETDNL